MSSGTALLADGPGPELAIVGGLVAAAGLAAAVAVVLLGLWLVRRSRNLPD